METDYITDPLVSVIIPVFNTAQYITGVVNSVLDQTYHNIEIIIIDDGSTDNTKEILSKKFKHVDRIRIEYQINRGASAARNSGFGFSEGMFVKFLDGDDIISPEMIKNQVELAIKNRDCIISGRWGRFHNNNLSTVRFNMEECWQTMSPIEWVCSSWKSGESMTNPGIFLLPRNLILKAGLWDERLSLFDDTEYFTRTILLAKQVVFCERCVLYYRSGVENSLSSKFSYNHAKSAYDAISKSTEYLLDSENTELTRLRSADAFQQLLYRFYPDFKDICCELDKKIRLLGGSSVPWRSSVQGRMFGKLIGWKNAQRLRNIKREITKWLR